MFSINPIELHGNWEKGYALDKHTLSSELKGYDELGHEIFDTKYSEIGEKLYRLKYRSDRSSIDEIVEVVADFLANKWKITGTLDFLVPVPPSNPRRKVQPVIEIAQALSYRIRIPLCADCITKVKVTPELKGVFEYDERLKLLEDAFDVKGSALEGKQVLLFDDLFRSGATVGVLTQLLYARGRTKTVFVLALTKTRVKA